MRCLLSPDRLILGTRAGPQDPEGTAAPGGGYHWAMPSVLGTILANIPWGQVVESAPKIAQGAGRLWETVKNRRNEPTPDAPSEAPGEPDPLMQLQAQHAALQLQVHALQDEMRASTQLVKDLADQNAQLVERVQAIRQRRSSWWC